MVVVVCSRAIAAVAATSRRRTVVPPPHATATTARDAAAAVSVTVSRRRVVHVVADAQCALGRCVGGTPLSASHGDFNRDPHSTLGVIVVVVVRSSCRARVRCGKEWWGFSRGDGAEKHHRSGHGLHSRFLVLSGSGTVDSQLLGYGQLLLLNNESSISSPHIFNRTLASYKRRCRAVGSEPSDPPKVPKGYFTAFPSFGINVRAATDNDVQEAINNESHRLIITVDEAKEIWQRERWAEHKQNGVALGVTYTASDLFIGLMTIRMTMGFSLIARSAVATSHDAITT